MRKIFRNTWWFVVPLGFSALFFSTIGFSEYFVQHKIPHSPFEAIYRSMMLFPINMGTIDDEIPIFLEIGRWLALLTLITAGYSTVLALARDRIRLMSLKYSKGHVVICGLGTKGSQIARDFLTNKSWKNNVVIVEKDSSVEDLEVLRDKDAVVIQGSATDPYVLEKANVINASVLYAVTNDDHVNVNIANWAYNKKIRVKDNGKVNEKDVGTGRTELRAFVHIFDLTLKNTFKKHRVFQNTKDNKNLFSAKIFNIYETSARSILKEYPPDLYTPVCKSEDPPIHIMIVGFGRRGQSLLLQFCKICQYANGKKPIVTIIDPDAEVKIKRLEGKYEALNQVVQIRSFNGIAEDFIVNVKEKKIPIDPEGA